MILWLNNLTKHFILRQALHISHIIEEACWNRDQLYHLFWVISFCDVGSKIKEFNVIISSGTCRFYKLPTLNIIDKFPHLVFHFNRGAQFNLVQASIPIKAEIPAKASKVFSTTIWLVSKFLNIPANKPKLSPLQISYWTETAIFWAGRFNSCY